MILLRAAVVDQKIVEAFEADGLVLHDFRNMVGALINVGIGDDQQHALRRALDQAASRFENGDTGSFGSDERARNMKAVFRQQVIQVVAGDAARNIGKSLADEVAIVDRRSASAR